MIHSGSYCSTRTRTMRSHSACSLVRRTSTAAWVVVSVARPTHLAVMRLCSAIRNYPGTLNSCETWGIQFMMRLMNFRMPTDAAIHTAFEKGETAVMGLFHHVADQMAELAR